MSEHKSTGLIFITGIAGTGKSALQKRLAERGYESIDADHGYCAFVNIHTGKETVGPTLEVRTPEWLKNHKWRFIPAKLNELKAQARNRLIFLCGNARNSEDYKDYFAKVFALTADDETIARRLKERPGKQSDHELQLTLADNAVVAKKYTKLGAILVDARQPLDDIIDEIMQQINS